jgi:hypothetical protein
MCDRIAPGTSFITTKQNAKSGCRTPKAHRRRLPEIVGLFRTIWQSENFRCPSPTDVTPATASSTSTTDRRMDFRRFKITDAIPSHDLFAPVLCEISQPIKCQKGAPPKNVLFAVRRVWTATSLKQNEFRPSSFISCQILNIKRHLFGSGVNYLFCKKLMIN